MVQKTRHDDETDDLKRRLAHLEAENSRLRLKEAVHTQLLDAMQDMILCKDASSHIVYANRAFREFYGMSMEELMGIIDTPKNREEWTSQYLIDDAYVINTGSVLTIEEEPATKYDGTVRYFNTIKSPLFGPAGAKNMMVAVCRDITERKEVERRVSEFNSMVSHELRTPLTAIRAALGLIEGGTTEPISDTNLELVGIARAECDRMIRLINDLLDIKKIAANKLELKLQPLNPTDILGIVVAAMSGVAKESDIEMILVLQDLRTFMGDRDRIIQVITNLVSNALKFSPEKTHVKISTITTAEGSLRFTVSDKGPGILESDSDRLFVAFQQLDSSDTRAQGGTGLGLAISKAIVECHGGKIGFDSNPDGGTTFWFDLPVIPGVEKTSPNSSSVSDARVQ